MLKGTVGGIWLKIGYKFAKIMKYVCVYARFCFLMAPRCLFFSSAHRSTYNFGLWIHLGTPGTRVGKGESDCLHVFGNLLI